MDVPGPPRRRRDPSAASRVQAPARPCAASVSHALSSGVPLGPNDRLERSQWDFFWIPDDAQVLDRPEVAAVRCDRRIAHLNLVTRTRAEPARLPALVRDTWAFIGHDEARWMVPDTIETAPLEAALRGADWAPVFRYEARAIRPSEHTRRAHPRFDVRRVVSHDMLRDCVAVTGRAFGREPPPYDDAQLTSELAQCRDPGGRVHRFVVYDGDRPVSSGGFNWYPDLRFAFLWAGGTVPEARGSGAYTALVAARVAGAGAMGASFVGLYAKDDTSAPIVARQGFARVGEMSYWAPAAAAAEARGS